MSYLRLVYDGLLVRKSNNCKIIFLSRANQQSLWQNTAQAQIMTTASIPAKVLTVVQNHILHRHVQNHELRRVHATTVVQLNTSALSALARDQQQH